MSKYDGKLLSSGFFGRCCLNNLTTCSLDLAFSRTGNLADGDGERLAHFAITQKLYALVVVTDETCCKQCFACNFVAFELRKLTDVDSLEAGLEVLVVETTAWNTIKWHLATFETDTDTTTERDCPCGRDRCLTVTATLAASETLRSV